MNKKRIVSFILAIIMIIGVLPLGDVVYGQEGYTVSTINIYRSYESLSDKGTYAVSVSGTGLSKVSISYNTDAGDEFIPLTNPLPGSDDYFRQYRMDPDVTVSQIRVGNQEFNINETNMPKVTEIDPKEGQIDLGKVDAKVTLEGVNYDKIDDKTTITISNVGVTDKFKNTNNKAILDKSTLSKLQHGIKHIVIKREDKKGDVNIITTYNQRNSFRIYESINIDEKNDITIYPNRGKVGTETTITINGNKENFSVFFLKEETDPFMYENMGEEPYYPQTTDDKGIIKVKVPKGLDPGITYKVVITNNLDTVKKPETDLTNFVTKQKTIGEFYVVDANVGPSIDKVVPKEGTSDGSYVTIYGYRFEELKMNGLTGDITPVKTDNLEVLKGGVDEPTKLRINYDKTNLKYNEKSVNKITRDFLVTIGRDALFEDEHKAKNIFIPGDDKVDQLYVRTKLIDGEDLKNPVKDVIIEINTIIKTEDGEEYVFTEVAILPKGYTFLPSHQDPVIEKVTPDKIQVTGETNPETKKDTILSIQGKNFNVFRYKENGEFMTNYPKVVLGGSNEETGQIIIERKADGEIVYYTKAEDGTIEKADGPKNPIFEVLDKNGNIVTGIGGNEVGDSIVIKIPKGLNVSANILNKPQPVAVANPKRDSEDRGIYSYKNDIISFVTVTSEPIIEKVDPYIVTVEGGEDIVIEGRNFQDGIKVFIDGKEVQNVVRDIDKQTTRGTLKFKAPKGREGENIVQVMNPDGGTDTHEFIYVQTMKIDPKISSIAPAKGTKDTLVVIKGNNFLKPDQTTTDITGLGIHKLIGTRVFLGKEDVNTYNAKGLEEYSSPKIEDKKLLEKGKDDWTNRDELVLSPYYKSATIKDKSGKNYSIYVDYEGNPVISGEEHIYTFKLIGEDIKALDQKGQYYNVVSDEGSLKLTDEEGKNIEFDIDFNHQLFSIGENEFGNKYLRVADYYDSLILKKDDNFYIIEVDDMNRVTLSDGKNDMYEIILDNGEIYATKGSDKYKVIVEDGSIKIGEEDDNTLTFHTPYYIDPTTQIITGHRAKVKNKNEIWVTIPEKSIPGFYDVTVRNPDTKSDTVKNGFEYLIPQSKPSINYITPSQGSVDGGYEIVIYGDGFEDTTEVYIAGVRIPEKDVKVNKQDYKSIVVTVPKYPGDVSTDFITDKKFVPVVVLNEDGGSANREDLFAYVIASSRPRIDRINPVKGSAAGGDIIEIWGYDFRFFEPYKGDIPKDGDNNYEDIDRNGRWTNMKNEDDCEEKVSIDHPLFEEYCASPVLPKVFFGNEEAKIVEFREGYIKVIAPRSSTIGPTDVYVLNNDAGTSNKVRFTFEGSNPTINSIVPGTGKKQGGERVDLIGSNFKPNRISLYNIDGEEVRETTYLVRFGEITNRNIPRENENSGRIDSGRATVNLAGGLRAEYKLDSSGTPTIKLTLQEGNKVYEGEYFYDSGEKYINLKSLKSNDDTSYPGFELLKVEIANGRLLVDRGYAPETKQTFRDHLEVLTPSYYTVGNVNVVLENPDGISNKVGFQYKNPDSKPEITNITRDGNEPVLGDDGRIKVVPVHYQGGSIITVTGKDFRENATIQIGNILTINPNDIEYTLPYKMTFTMPAVDESALGRLHKVVVINEDGGTASSDSLDPPIYIQFTKGESNPSIESITPDRGPTKGGTKVIIKGNDFRDTMEGYEGKKLKVYFGEHPVPTEDINVIDYKTIEVITPPGTPGRVEVKVENPDGTLARPSGYFTYISGPIINNVEDPITGKKINHISVKGGQELRLKGQEFLPGARVVFAPKLRKAETGETGQIIYIEGQAYILEEGLNGTNFEFIDEETVLITTPQGKLGDKGVIIINPDGGASPIYDIVYDLPEIEAPEEVIAELVFDKYIKVHWQPVPGADYYEIYEVDSRGRDEFIGSTELTSFLYKDIEPRTTYRFLIKAVGEFGSSPPSMISNRVRTGSNAGYEDKDGELGEKTTIVKTGQLVNIGLGSKDYHTTSLNLKDIKYKGTKEIIVSIPLGLVYNSKDSNKLTIIGEDFNLAFSPNVFKNKSYEKHKGDKNAGIRLKISYHTGNTNLNGKTSLSNQLLLEGEFYAGKKVEKVKDLSNQMNLKLNYDIDKANLRKITHQDIYYFDDKQSKWILLPNTTSSYYNEIRGNLNKLGRYAILGHRR